VVRISYRDLPPGVYAQAEPEGRRTIIYMLPGLTPAQRRAALRRLRHSARMGHSPALPLAALALAVTVDRIRATAGSCAAVVRVHPAGSALPVMALSAATVMYVLLSSVSVHVLRAPQSPGQGLAPGQGQAAFPFPGHGTREADPPQGSPGTSGPSRPAGSQKAGTPGAASASSGLTARRVLNAGSVASPAPGSGQAGSGAAAAGQAGSGAAAADTGPSSAPAPQASPLAPSPVPSPAAAAGDPSPLPSPAPPSPGRGNGSGNGICVDIGSLGVCLTLP
jgi:hypothetical protein